MAKTTAWKIDFLMKVTGVSNSELARQLGYDASYISRIRHGKRGLPPEGPFVEPACELFAKRVLDDYQRRVLGEELGCPWPDSRKKGSKLLSMWLASDTDGSTGMLSVFKALDGRPGLMPETVIPVVRRGRAASADLYFGNAGKRDAVTAFLSALCATGEPHTLLLHSDEDMTWLYEEPEFARQWADLLLQLAVNGGKVRIIHSIGRNANEMWEAVSKWMPLYMSGAIEPYYYPHLRDGVYRRTLFVAPGHSAIVAASVLDGIDGALNVFVNDSAAVSALEKEFESYFALCLPLMQTHFPDEAAEMGALVSEFGGTGEDILALLEDGKLVCAFEGGPALAANVDSPLVAFTIEEPRMAEAIWNYLQTMPAGNVSRGADAQTLLSEVAAGLRAC